MLAYGSAVLLISLSIAISVFLPSVLVSGTALLLLTAVVASSALGGMAPGMVSTTAGTLVLASPLLAGHGTLGAAQRGDASSILLFAVAGALTTMLAAGARSRVLAAAAAKVQQRLEYESMLMDAPHFALWDWDVRTGHLSWNQSIASTFGWTEALQGTDMDWWEQCIHPEDRDRLAAAVHSLLDSGRSSWMEQYRFRRSDGSYAEVLDYVAWVTRDAHGHLQRVVGTMIDLTQHRQVERDLHESERRFRQIADNIRDVFWVVDADERRVLYVSPAFERIWGMSCKALYADYMEWEQAIHPEDRARAAHDMFDGARNGSVSVEYRFIPAGGQMMWIRDRAFPIADESGRVYRIAGVAEDITERRQMEVSQQFMNDLVTRMGHTAGPEALGALVTRAVGAHLQVARCVFAEVDAEGARLRVEHAYEHGPGLPSVVGVHPLSSAMPGQDELAALQRGEIITGKPPAAEAGPWHAGGIRAMAAAPVRQAGRWVALLWVGSDRARAWTDAERRMLQLVAERAWLAIENARLLERTLTALQERDASLRARQDSDMRLSLALEAAHVAIYDWDLTTDAMICSPGYAPLFGRAPGTFAHSGQDMLRALHPEDRPRIQRNLSDAIARHQDLRCEYRTIWEDGSVHWLEGRARLFFADASDAGGARAVRLLGVLVDATHRKSVEAERALRLEREQAARAEAEAMSRAKDEFLAMLSHELRNPLSGIGNAVAVLAHLGDDDVMLVRARDVIARQLRHLVCLVDELLDVARVTSGKIVIKPRPLDLSDAVRHCLTVTTSPGHRIVADLEPAWIEGDETRIDQIVSNLLTNAIKYTPEGGTISLSTRARDDHVELVVADTGVGISGAMLPRIFELFSQERCGLDRTQGGLGIGLTLVQRLVQLHGGQITATSPGPGRGSTFTVRLPRPAA